MSPADTSLQGESKDPEHSNQQGASTPEVDEQSVIGTPTPLDATLLRQEAEIYLPLGKRAFQGQAAAAPVPRIRDPRLPSPGTVLTRPYRGRTIAVTVLESGFEYEGRRFDSLTAVAKAVTGSHWNGLEFFGLTKSIKKAS